MRQGVRYLIIAVMLALAPAAPRSQEPAEHLPIAAFFGTFEGRTLFPMGEQGNRGLAVTIREHDGDGFVIHWETTIPKGAEGAERHATSLTFKPSARPQIFEAIYPPGGEPSLIRGEPVAWARIAGSTLSVSVLTIVDGGDYVMQSYHRTLTDPGLKLEFLRIREGVVERQIKGNLTRVEPPTQDREPR